MSNNFEDIYVTKEIKMSKDPAFLFYPNDYIGGTMGMTFEEKGAYMELLMMQFNRGHMTSHMIGQTVGQLWGNLQVKFIQDPDGLWYNVRLEEEQIKRRKYSESRRNNLSGLNKYTNNTQKKGGHMEGHMEAHMENENINENKDINKDKNNSIIRRKKEFKKQVFAHTEKYPETTLNNFYEYWTEKNASGKKMRNEMQPTFEITKRLATWARNDKSFKTGAGGKSTGTRTTGYVHEYTKPIQEM